MKGRTTRPGTASSSPMGARRKRASSPSAATAGWPAAHHITLRNLTFLSSLTGSATTTGGPSTDHAIYVSKAAGGPHDLVFEDITVDGRGGLASAIHFFSHDDASPNAWNVWVRGLTVTGTQQAIILWDSTLHNIVIDQATVTGALSYGVRYEDPGSDIFLANVTTTRVGQTGLPQLAGVQSAGHRVHRRHPRMTDITRVGPRVCCLAVNGSRPLLDNRRSTQHAGDRRARARPPSTSRRRRR